MNYNGNVQLTVVFVCSPEYETEGDLLWSSHAAWMEDSHYREGEKALLQYIVSKGADDDGNILFVLTEVYASETGRKDHSEQAQDWKDYDDWKIWVGKCKSTWVDTKINRSLW